MVNILFPRQSEVEVLKHNKFERPTQESTSRAAVRILATSDLHMHLMSFDYYADSPDSNKGLTRTASLIHSAREQARRDGALVLLFDNGDALQGTPFGDWAFEAARHRHPLPQAFDTLGYDAVGLGNHDFGFGLEFVNQIAAQTACPTICSNMQTTQTPQGWVNHAILKRVARVAGQDVPIRIGVLSVLPPQTVQWEAHVLQDQAVATDILTAAETTADALRHDGCDLVVALAHSGLDQADAEAGIENAVIPLAELSGVDVIVAGHTHLTLPGKAHEGLPNVDPVRGLVHGKPVVMQGWGGSHLGIIDLVLQQNTEGVWRIVESRVEAVPISTTAGPAPEDPGLKQLFVNGHEKTRIRVSKPVGSVSKTLHSYFSYCAPDRGLALMAAAQAAALRQCLVDTKWKGIPILSATAPAKFGGRAGPRHYTEVPAGAVSIRHVADLHVFPNELRAVLVTGAQVRDWLEMSAGVLNQLSPPGPSNLIDPRHAGYNFDVLHGARYRIDLSQPARFDSAGRLTDPAHSRIRDLSANGQPITPDQTFIVATNNYRASGGGHFPFAGTATDIALPSLRIHDILCDYLTGKRPADPLEQAPRPFVLDAPNGTKAILTTSPAAQAYLHELAEYDPQVKPINDEGYLPIHLTL